MDRLMSAVRSDRPRVSLERARRASTLLDEAIRIPGTQRRVGLDPILGLVPVGGDLLAMVGALYIVFEGIRAGLPRHAVFKMLLLIAVDTAAGSVPVIGDLFDAVWKANRRNVAMIEDHVDSNEDRAATAGT